MNKNGKDKRRGKERKNERNYKKGHWVRKMKKKWRRKREKETKT